MRDGPTAPALFFSYVWSAFATAGTSWGVFLLRPHHKCTKQDVMYHRNIRLTPVWLLAHLSHAHNFVDLLAAEPISVDHEASIAPLIAHRGHGGLVSCCLLWGKPTSSVVLERADLVGDGISRVSSARPVIYAICAIYGLLGTDAPVRCEIYQYARDAPVLRCEYT